jgi:hypothetical protein
MPIYPRAPKAAGRRLQRAAYAKPHQRTMPLYVNDNVHNPFFHNHFRYATAVFVDVDRAVVDAVIQPVASYLQFIGQLWNGQVAWNPTRVRLVLPNQKAVPQANGLHSAGKHDGGHRRSMAARRQQQGDLLIRLSIARHADDGVFYILRVGEMREAVNVYRDVYTRRQTPAPDHTSVDLVTCNTV